MKKKDFLGKFLEAAVNHNWNFAFVDDKIYVTATFGKFILTMPGVFDEDFEQVLAILEGERDISILRHMARVVGYYSRLENFNSGKIEEMRARAKGKYGIDSERDEKKRKDAMNTINKYKENNNEKMSN